VIITGLPEFTGLGIALISFRLILSVDVDVAARLFGLLAGLPVPSWSKLELKSEFLSLFCCGLLKLEGVSFIGLPSRKLFALADQSSCAPHVAQVANALKDKLASITIMDAKIRRITDFFITSPFSHYTTLAKFSFLECSSQ
jgi:hypothetical protein